jgi:hypothetical protein
VCLGAGQPVSVVLEKYSDDLSRLTCDITAACVLLALFAGQKHIVLARVYGIEIIHSALRLTWD